MTFDSLFHKSSRVTNHEGAQAYAMSPEMELYTAVVTSSLSPMTYEGEDERVNRITELVGRCDPMFVAQLAIYTRTQMYMRSIPLLLAVELAKVHNGDNLVSRMVNRIVLRADEIMELLACYQWRNPVPVADNPQKSLARLSRQIKKGLQQSFNNFDEYQLAKYDSASRSIKLRDALFLVHPKAKSAEQQAIFDRITTRTLATPYTWETELSALGQQIFESPEAKEQAKSDKWSELILSGRLGYMALLRNLNNILSCSNVSSETMQKVVDTISEREAVLSSKQFPFRFLAAYREISQAGNLWTAPVMEALEEAVRHSAQSIQGFSPETRVVLASDVSGSMTRSISPRSTIRCYDIGLMLSMLLRNRCSQVITGIFGNTWKQINLPAGNILANVNQLYKRANEVGYSTNGHLVINDLIYRKIVADKVMMFTDLQMWNSTYDFSASLRQSWHHYKDEVAPEAKLYLFDLNGYGESPLSLAEKDVYLIAGWSDKVFDILEAIDNGSSALAEIRKIQI